MAPVVDQALSGSERFGDCCELRRQIRSDSTHNCYDSQDNCGGHHAIFDSGQPLFVIENVRDLLLRHLKHGDDIVHGKTPLLIERERKKCMAESRRCQRWKTISTSVPPAIFLIEIEMRVNSFFMIDGVVIWSPIRMADKMCAAQVGTGRAAELGLSTIWTVDGNWNARRQDGIS